MRQFARQRRKVAFDDRVEGGLLRFVATVAVAPTMATMTIMMDMDPGTLVMGTIAMMWPGR